MTLGVTIHLGLRPSLIRDLVITWALLVQVPVLNTISRCFVVEALPRDNQNDNRSYRDRL